MTRVGYILRQKLCQSFKTRFYLELTQNFELSLIEGYSAKNKSTVIKNQKRSNFLQIAALRLKYHFSSKIIG